VESAEATERWHLRRWLPGISTNLAQVRSFRQFSRQFSGPGKACVLVVGSGLQVHDLIGQLAPGANVELVCTDIDSRALVDCYCDAHELPFVDGCFDGVIVTAVLEHVCDPYRVAIEIGRVTKLGGLLYSEIPFLQQVHEGAYDFTRFTLQGHRRLFRRYEKIAMGLVAGPGTVLGWAMEGFFLSLLPGRFLRTPVKLLVRLGFFWLKYFDYFMQNRLEAMDGASCTYFMGRKSSKEISDQEIIADYVGAQNLRHC
jgi:SAM-dependent methyltransferase